MTGMCGAIFFSFAEGQCQSVNAAAPNERITGGASRNRGSRLDPALADFRNKIRQ
jgi:hypothetical protein